MEVKEVIVLITKIRKEKKISQKEMAEQLGISFNQYNRYENSKSIMNLKTFFTTLEILEVDIKDFFFLKPTIENIKSSITKADLNKIQIVLDKVKSKLDK